jgi:MFS family permease
VSSLVINMGFGLAGGLIGMSVVSRFGSRRVTLVGFTIQAAALFTLAAIGVPSSALVLVAVAMLAAFIFAQAGGPGANLMNFATLSYPTRLRGIGVGFNQGTLRAFSVLSLLGFPILTASAGHGRVLDRRLRAPARRDLAGARTAGIRRARTLRRQEFAVAAHGGLIWYPGDVLITQEL